MGYGFPEACDMVEFSFFQDHLGPGNVGKFLEFGPGFCAPAAEAIL